MADILIRDGDEMIDPIFLERLRCPNTGEILLNDGKGYLQNVSGTYRYPVIFGIPDFRLFDPPYMTREEELACAVKIDKAAQQMTYTDLLAHFEHVIFPHSRKTSDIEKSLEHRRALLRRSPGRLDYLINITKGAARPHGLTLDLGCGSGEATAALHERGAATVIGLDISLVELMLARKLLAEVGQPAYLVAGCAEALPFKDELFDFIYSPDVIEHVSNQTTYFKEARRALAPTGQFLLNSPNRYSVVCPEPHVGIWFLGFAPRRLMDGLCRLAGKGGYIGKRLVSLSELRAMLSGTFQSFRIFSRKANPHSRSLAGRLFYSMRGVAEPAYSYVCDQHVILVESK